MIHYLWPIAPIHTFHIPQHQWFILDRRQTLNSANIRNHFFKKFLGASPRKVWSPHLLDMTLTVHLPNVDVSAFSNIKEREFKLLDFTWLIMTLHGTTTLPFDIQQHSEYLIVYNYLYTQYLVIRSYFVNWVEPLNLQHPLFYNLVYDTSKGFFKKIDEDLNIKVELNMIKQVEYYIYNVEMQCLGHYISNVEMDCKGIIYLIYKCSAQSIIQLIKKCSVQGIMYLIQKSSFQGIIYLMQKCTARALYISNV